MATRYWVGGAGNWSSTTKWSTTSGGTSGASVPTSVDDVIFDANSGGKFTAAVDTAITCASLSITPSATTGVLQIAITSSLTVTGAFSTSSTAGNNRIWFRGTTYGVRSNLVCNGTVSISDCDFRDIIVNGTAAPISGTRIGNRGACAGITFDAPKNVYWTLGTGSWSANGWASTSGGTANTDYFPLPQDTAVFDNNSGSAGVQLTLNNAITHVSNVDFSARTTAFSVNFFQANTVYGSWTNGSGVSFTGSSTLTFSGEGTKTITSAGKTFSCPITIDAYGGTVELADALNIGSQTLTVTTGTFDTKGYAVTAAALSVGGSNVRTVNLGASTVTLSGGSPYTIGSVNSTFNAGTSSIVCTNATIAVTALVTFYNVSFTGGAGTRQFTGTSTYNNLSFSAPAGAGLTTVNFISNQTITGTLTCAGSSPTQRIFVRSNTIGTPTTITANAISANDCDFRDITIAGSAAGASPTRAGDCGGNSGINFPAPKTVYWNLSGTQNWSATGWATSSGGTPAVNNFPLAQDTIIFDDAGAAGTVNINAAWNIGTFDASARTGSMTVTVGISPFIYGSFSYGSGLNSISTIATITFIGRSTQTITSAGKTLDCPVAVNSLGTVQLADALTLGSTRTLTLVSGTFDAVSYNVTIGGFSAATALVKTLKMGSGLWTLAATGFVWDMASSGLTLLKGTADILLSDTSTTARTFNGGGLSYNKLTIGGATGTSTLTISGNNQFTELASTKTVAHTIALGTTTQTFGAWTVTGSAGNVVTLTGTGIGHIIAGSAPSGIDYLAMGSIGFSTGSFAEFYAGANSTGTATAPVYRTAKPADSTRYWVGGTGNWSDTARWSASSGGASGASVPRSHDDVVFDSSSNATAYTATVNAVTGGIRCKSLTIAPPASGNVTLAGSTNIVGIHGDVTLPATGLTRTYSGNITLSGSTTGKTFTTNGVTLDSIITVNGVGCGWTLGSALNIGNRGFTVANGSFDTGNFNLTAGSFLSNNANTRSITLGSSTLSITNIEFSNSTNLSFNAGTSQINTAASNALINGGGQTYNNLSFTSTAAANARTITGANTFNNLSLTASGTGLSQLSINANQTITGTLTCSGSSAVARGFVRSDTIGTTRTLTVGTLAANDCDFRDITIAGTASGTAPTRAGDCGGNSGITFPAPKTVYFSLAGGGFKNWSETAWATSSGGTPAVNNFPLAQDTAVFDNNVTTSGTSIVIQTYNIGSIDGSTRTLTLGFNHSNPATIYGNYTLGSGTNTSGIQPQTFSGRGTMTFTSAGKTITFPITVDTPTGTFQLGDAFTSSNSTNTALYLLSGTFNANDFNVSLTNNSSGVVASVGSAIRTLAFGSGTWTLASANGYTASSANLTVTGNCVINLTSASAKTFAGGGLSYSGITLNQGGTGTLTITGNNTFAGITSTATGATTIALGTTTQRVGAFTVTGTAGNVVTITGNTSNLIYTGGSNITGLDYLNVQGRVYGSAGQITDVWYAGANSVNSGSLGWVFAAGVAPPPSANTNFFLMFG